MIRILVLLVVLGISVPPAALARGSDEAGETPKASSSVRPSASPERDMEEEREREEERELESELEEEEEDLPEIEVPDDLDDDAEELVSENDDIREIKVEREQKRVEVSYRLRAKLFGLIDVPYELQAKVDAKEGVIEARGPWWLLFARDNAPEVQAALEADTTLLKQTNQGKVLSSIIAILKSIAER